jgi:hypothetical protein
MGLNASRVKPECTHVDARTVRYSSTPYLQKQENLERFGIDERWKEWECADESRQCDDDMVSCRHTAEAGVACARAVHG